MRLNAVGLGIVKRWGRGGAGGRKGRGGSEGALREDLGKASEGVNQFFNSLLTYSLKETLLRNKHFVSLKGPTGGWFGGALRGCSAGSGVEREERVRRLNECWMAQ